MAIRFIECSGTEYPMGVLQGRLLKDSIAKSWEVLQDSQEMEHVRPKLVPKALHLLHSQKKAVTFIKNYMAKFINHQSERILGLTNGANLTQETLFFLQAYEMELQAKLDTFALNSGTVVALTPDKTSSEEPIIAKNLDMSIDLRDHLLVRKSKPRSGFASLELTHSFMAGTYSGMNEHGLTVVQTPCYCTDSLSLKAVPLAILIQEALQTCRTTDEAIAAITTKHHRDVGGNVLIMDSTKNIKVVEVSRTKSAVYQPTDSITILTNRYSTPEMQALQYPADSLWNAKAMEKFSGKPVYHSSQARLEKLQELLQATKLLFDFDNLQEIMTDIYTYSTPFTTQATIVFLPQSRTIEVSSGNADVGEYSKYVL